MDPFEHLTAEESAAYVAASEQRPGEDSTAWAARTAALRVEAEQLSAGRAPMADQ